MSVSDIFMLILTQEPNIGKKTRYSFDTATRNANNPTLVKASLELPMKKSENFTSIS